ncbi:pilus assembly protein [Roseobacter ponti]|uniref:Pilus assembly protein n=2 Tax=Roseobacter ponti TaxID=1891787 RepID=A0A858SVY2_9RHOB|nr:pilus assembly protein [Roseobacter ponti]
MSVVMSRFSRRFARSEDGQIVIEFVLLVPLLFTILLTAFELGLYAKRQFWLDRGLDIAVREVRLNTGSIPDHDGLKDVICAQAPFIPDCADSLKLEMIKVDPRSFTQLSSDIDCVDRSQPVTSDDDPNYQTGEEHDLMMVRACVKFDPIFPTTGLGFHFVKDGSGQAAMFATSAFVQEPG